MRSARVGFGARLLPCVARGLAEPWSVPDSARELRDALLVPSLPPLVASAARWLELDVAKAESGDPRFAALDALWLEIAPPAAGAAASIEGEALLARLSDFVGGCHDALAELLPGASDEERARLRRDFPDWCEVYRGFNAPNCNPTAAQWALYDDYKKLVRKVDRARLLAVSARVARLADPAFVATLGKRLARTPRAPGGVKLDGFAGDVIAIAGDAPANRVVLLGPGKSTVSGGAALVIDLGGDDVWQRAAVADDEACLVSVVLELAGDDTYSSGASGAITGPGPAYAAGGVALLVDARGDDSYASGRLGQGASSLGVAALVDLAGNDRFTAADYGQGFTFCGVALVVDRAGRDVYDAWAFAQGASIGDGFAACVDGAGDDRFVANGHWPDVYGDSGPGSFNGDAQGYATGIRRLRGDDGPDTELAGGIAALVDAGAGKDYYESGNFSQGGGYFFGFGLMFDGGGNDENHGYRYSQGFGVHQAVGIRWDAGGDDAYSTKCAANCGAAWDEGVGWLIDESGDDVYEVGGLALGGTANTGVALLLDGGGDDRYGGGGGNDAQGGSSDSSYHQFQAIGALLDLGGGKDTYSRKDRGDDRILTGDWYGLFVDAKEKELAKLLDPKLLQRLLAPQKPSGAGAAKQSAK